ncbi:MAG TPA: tetratricopeptide repeat protein, partial [Acidobacteriota bacterium]
SMQSGRTVTPEERETLQSLGYFAAGPVKVSGASIDPKDRVEVARKIAELTATAIPLKTKAKAYEEIVRDEPENPLLLLRYAEILLKLQEFNQAQAMFQKVMKLGHASAYAYNGLAAAYFSQQKLEEAEKTLRQAVKEKRADGETYYNLGEFLLNRGARDEAFRYYDESIKLDFRPAFFRKARLKDVIGATEEAHRILQAAEKSDPRDFRVNYERGLIYYRHNQAQQALAELQKALEKSPVQKLLYYEIGLVYLRLNQLENAQTAMRQFLAAAPAEMKKERAYAEEVLKQNPS